MDQVDKIEDKRFRFPILSILFILFPLPSSSSLILFILFILLNILPFCSMIPLPPFSIDFAAGRL